MRPTLRPLLPFTTLAALAALAAPAAAEEPPARPAPPLAFTTLGPDGSSNHVSLGLGIQSLDGADSTIQRFDVGAQFVSATHVGAYASVGVAHIQDVTDLTGIELGGLYHSQRGASGIAVRVGVALPTGGTSEDELIGIVSTMLARPSDLAMTYPETTTVRFAVAPTYRSGHLVLRGDAGLDLPFSSNNDGGNPDPLYHVDLAAGYEGAGVGGTAELQTVGSTGGDGTLHVLAFGLQGRSAKIVPFGTLSIPFASDDDYGSSFNVLGGVRFVM